MKVIDDSSFRKESHELKDYIYKALDGEDCDRGVLEEAAATSDNVAKAFGRLVEVLVEKGSLPLDRVHFVLNGYDSDCLKIDERAKQL